MCSLLSIIWNTQFRSKVNYLYVNLSGRLHPGVMPITGISILVRLHFILNRVSIIKRSRFLFANWECYIKHYNTPSKDADTWHRSACSIVTLLRKKRLPRIFNNKHNTPHAQHANEDRNVFKMLHLHKDRDNTLNTMLTGKINSVWPSNALWRRGHGSTLAWVMTCCRHMIWNNVDLLSSGI